MSFGGQAPPTTVPVPPPAPVMPGLNQQFQGVIGSAGPQAISTLQGISSKGLDVSGIFNAIKTASAAQQKQGEADLESKFAATGGSLSTDMMKQLSQYNIDYGAQLDQTLAKLGAESVGVQLAASQTLEETFGNAAMTFAPTAQVAGGAVSGNSGGALIQGGTDAAMIALLLAGFI